MLKLVANNFKMGARSCIFEIGTILMKIEMSKKLHLFKIRSSELEDISNSGKPKILTSLHFAKKY